MGSAGSANADPREIPLDRLGLDPVGRIRGERWNAMEPGPRHEAAEEDEACRIVRHARRRVFGSEGMGSTGDPGGLGFSQCSTTARAEEAECVLDLPADKMPQPGLQDGPRARFAAASEEKEGKEPNTVSPSAHGPDLRPWRLIFKGTAPLPG